MVWAVSLSTTDLITRSLTPGYKSVAFGVYLNSVTQDGPLVQTVISIDTEGVNSESKDTTPMNYEPAEDEALNLIIPKYGH